MALPNEKVLDRLRRMKLAMDTHSKTGESFSTEAEAQNFAATLSRLLMEHDLQMSDIEYEAKDDTVEERAADFSKWGGVDTRPRRVVWMEELSGIIAEAFNCRRWIIQGRSKPWLIGRKQDIDIAEYMIIVLTRTADNMSEAETKRFKRQMKRTCIECNHGLSWHELRIEKPDLPWDVERHPFQNSMEKSYGFRVSFLNAFIRRLNERLQEERQRVMDEAAASGQALMRIDNALAKVDAFIEERRKGKRGKGAPQLSRTWHHNSAGAARGKAVADGVKLRADALTTNGSAAKQIGGGQ